MTIIESKAAVDMPPAIDAAMRCMTPGPVPHPHIVGVACYVDLQSSFVALRGQHIMHALLQVVVHPGHRGTVLQATRATIHGDPDRSSDRHKFCTTRPMPQTEG